MDIQVYISLPMSGFEDTIRKRWDDAVNKVKEIFYDCNVTIVGPTNIDDFDYNGAKVPHDKKWSYYISKDVEPLLDSTHIFLCKGWEKSKGCKLESVIANEMNLKVMMESDYEQYKELRHKFPVFLVK